MLDEDPRTAHELESDEPAPGAPEREEHPGSERRRRPVADWGGDELFNHVPRRRFSRTGVGAHTRRPSSSPITSHQLRRNTDFTAGPPARGTDASGGIEPGGTLSAAHAAVQPAYITIYEQDASARLPETALAPGSVAARNRQRPRRSVDERVGPRPDRIAALAFVLGLLLVLLAVATADAAALTAF